MNYDFYRKENIFILVIDDPKTLKNFVNSSYLEVPNEIVMKYDVHIWSDLIFEKR